MPANYPKWVAISSGALAALLSVSLPGRADVRQAVGKAAPATVCVEWQTATAEGQKKPSTDQKPDSVTLASGTLVSADGLIVTCVGRAGQQGRYQVTLSDGRELPARLLVDDRRSALRLLRIVAEDLPCVRLAEQEAEIGQEVVTVVCVDGTGRAASRGIVSMAEAWMPGGRMPLLLTDMAVGDLAAGAPLLDTDGKLLGVVTARRRSEESPGALAIHTRHVAALLEARQSENTVIVYAGFLGVSVESQKNEPPRVTEVVTGSPAEKAGFRKGDTILAINGRKVSLSEDMLALIGEHPAGTKVTVTVRREGGERSVEAVLDRRPEPARPPKADPLQVELVYPDQLNLYFHGPEWLDPEKRKMTNAGLATLLAVDLANASSDQAAKKGLEYLLFNTQTAAVERPTVRVSRSDVDQTIDRLRSDVETLRSQVQELTKEVEELREEIKTQRPADQGP
jgi:S1-C subfamily serine protease